MLKALEAEGKNAGATTKFVHNNAYKEEELGECFERNAEGMLKNSALHRREHTTSGLRCPRSLQRLDRTTSGSRCHALRLASRPRLRSRIAALSRMPPMPWAVTTRR